MYLSSKGYSVEFIDTSLTCFNAKEYSVLIIPDPELAFEEDEILKIR